MADLRNALRTLLKSPGFTFLAALLLAIGIGANAVIYGALDAILLRTLPVRHPEQLVRMVQDVPRLGRRSDFPYSLYRDLLEHSTTLATVFGQEEMQVAMDNPAPAEEVRVHLLTPEFFDALSIDALIGRRLTAADAVDSPGTPPAVLSYGFWRRRFSGDPHVTGRTLRIHGHTLVIVGVLPRGANGISIETAPDVCVPLRTAPLFQTASNIVPMESRYLDLGARLKPGVTRQRAQQEVRAMWLRSIENDKSARTEPLELDSLEHGTSILRQKFSGALRLLIAAVALLQLLVCANLAGLLVARGARRSNEIAIRLAIGATRSRLVRQMLAESAVLTALGATGGIALAYFAAPLLVRGLPPVRDLATTRLTLTLDFEPNGRVLLYSIVVSAVTALLFGMAPAWSAARVSLDSVLRGARSSTGWKGRQLLLVLQIALCTLLLAGAGLMVRSFRQLRLDAGFAPAQVVSFTANPFLAGYPEEQTATLRRSLVERVRQLPGVESVAAASRAVMRGSGIKMTIAPTGLRVGPGDFLNTSFNHITPDYFDTMGMHMLSGRDFAGADTGRSKPVPVVVNQAFVRHFFPSADPVGRSFGSGTAGTTAGSEFEIIGVVSDAHYRSLREPVPPVFYQPLVAGDFTLAVRTRRRPESLIQPVREALSALDAAIGFSEVHTLAEEVDDSAAPERLTAILASVFALFAALLASVGLYGLLAFAVAQRQREIGIRMALGAQPRSIAQLVGGQALVLVAVGVALGLAGALLLAPMASALLYGVAPSDPLSMAAAAALVTLVAAIAALIPATRAARVDPAIALRD
ncbi:MAG: ABC transporter permease [Ignavibacteriota bacterium]